MKELVVISGKGGTGKTSIVASMASLAGAHAVLADCDVDAADLHLILAPRNTQRHDFYSGQQAVIDPQRCTNCGACEAYCRFAAVQRGAAARPGAAAACKDCDFCSRSCSQRANDQIAAMMEASGTAAALAIEIDPLACQGCGVCARFCPAEAITLRPRLCGQWMISQTRVGSLVHARLAPAAENSGKLVSTVRQQARELARRDGCELVIIDGPPGVGCPVIASMTGATLAMIVTEPTLSGRHDMQRAADLARHFKIPAMICVNKWDLNPQVADDIEALAQQRGIRNAGRVCYDPIVTRAQIQGRAVVDAGPGRCADDIRRVWGATYTALENLASERSVQRARDG
ncbi:MAG: ATP-binding protein [Planctomycetaceae bacterium]|nr:ATP-binding protein [Planctomycetaceae bacterium]